MPPKYLFLDWAGDFGFKFAEGSSTHLIFAMAFMPDYSALRRALVSLRRDRRLPKDYEFHYVKTAKKVRQAFFQTLEQLDFTVDVLIVAKEDLPREYRRKNQYALYREFVSDLVRKVSEETFEGAILMVDARTTTDLLTQTLRVAVSQALRSKGVKRGLKKVRGKRSEKEDGLQLADMVAGAIAEGKVKGGADYLVDLREKIRVYEFRPE